MNLPTVEQIDIELSQRSLIHYIKFIRKDYNDGWFHRDLCENLDLFYKELIQGKCPRLMIFAPPQHGKSTIVSQFFPSWIMGHDPDVKIVDASYSSSLAEKNCAATQEIILHENYKKVFPKTKIGKANAPTGDKKKKQTNEIVETIGHSGYYKAVGAGGSLTGFSMTLGLIDDPFKDHQEAYSFTIREKVWNWYSTVFFTRKAPIHGLIIINTRWHDDDLCGRLLSTEADKWKILNYKGIATEDERYRKAGEALHPERYPLSQLLEFKEKYPSFFQAMYQGDPTPESGSLFKTDMFEFSDMPNSYDYTFMMGDTAYKDGDQNDYNCFAFFGVKNNNLYLYDIFRKKINAAQIEIPLVNFIKHNIKHPFRGCYIENKGHGLYLSSILPRHGVMVPSESTIKDFYKDRNKDKIERANNAIPYLGNKKIFINQNINEKDDILREILTFPKAKHDDITDCVIDALRYAYRKDIGLLDVL